MFKKQFVVALSIERKLSLSVFSQKPPASRRASTALKRPNRWKQCHSLQFAKCIASLLHHYNTFLMSTKLTFNRVAYKQIKKTYFTINCSL